MGPGTPPPPTPPQAQGHNPCPCCGLRHGPQPTGHSAHPTAAHTGSVPHPSPRCRPLPSTRPQTLTHICATPTTHCTQVHHPTGQGPRCPQVPRAKRGRARKAPPPTAGQGHPFARRRSAPAAAREAQKFLPPTARPRVTPPNFLQKFLQRTARTRAARIARKGRPFGQPKTVLGHPHRAPQCTIA